MSRRFEQASNPGDLYAGICVRVCVHIYCSMYSTVAVCILKTIKACCFECSSIFFSLFFICPKLGLILDRMAFTVSVLQWSLLFEQNESYLGCVHVCPIILVQRHYCSLKWFLPILLSGIKYWDEKFKMYAYVHVLEETGPPKRSQNQRSNH